MTFQPDLKLIAPDNTAMEIYLCRPSQFIIDNQQRLLPTWDRPVTQVVLVLQQSRLPMEHSNELVAREKDRLRKRFLHFGCCVVSQLRDRNLLGDLFDPRSGYPFNSREGEITLDDAAVVKTVLGFTVSKYKDCSLVAHPQWASAVYPATMVAAAPLEAIAFSIDEAIALLGWTSQRDANMTTKLKQ